MQEILKKIGWTDGFRVPISNAENSALEEELQNLSLRRHRAMVANETANNKYNALEKHLKYLHQESEQNQKLIALNKDQLQSDQHHYKLQECEREKFRHDIRAMHKELGDLDGRIQRKRYDLGHCMEKIEKLKTEQAWDAEALKAWEGSSKKRDEDNELLKKFSKEDEKRARELEAQRLNLQVDCNKRKQMVQTMVAELTNYEQIMERTGKILVQLKQEKVVLLHRWQDAVRNLRQRDDDIKRIQRDLTIAQDLLAQKKIQVEEQNTFYNNQLRNNRQLVLEIQDMNNENSRIRKELNENIDMNIIMNNEADTIKRAMLTAAQQLEKERTKSKMLIRDLDYKEYQIQNLEREVLLLKQKLEEVINSADDAAGRAKYLEDLIEYENKQTNVLGSDLTKIQNALYRTQRKLEDLKEVAKLHEMEINSFSVTMNILRKTISKLTVEKERCKELVYDLDFRRCMLESKIASMEGTVHDDLLEEFIQKIKDLEGEIKELNEIKTMLQGQITRLNNDRRKLTNTLEADKKVIEDLRNKLQNFVLLYEGGLKQTAAAKLVSQKKQVEENMLRLKVDNLGNGTKKQEKHIYNLQKFRLELDAAMKERQIEIEAHKKVLLAKRKNIDEELGRLRADIMGRNVKIKHLQSRYYVALTLLGKDEFGQPLSIAHFKIKNAQEKYMLQMEGDELDQKIKTAEKEIIAMENTLKVVNFTNAKYRDTLGPVQEDGQELKDMANLSKELQDTKIIMRNRRRVLKAKLTDLESYEELLTAKHNEGGVLMEELKDYKSKLDNYAINFEDSESKLQRCDKHLRRARKLLSKMDIQFESKDFDLRLIQSNNFCTIQQLKEMPKKYEQFAHTLQGYFIAFGLEMRPSLIRSTTSSFSEGPIASLYSSSTSASSIDYGIPIKVTSVTLEYPSEAGESVRGSVASTTPSQKVRKSIQEEQKKAPIWPSSIYRPSDYEIKCPPDLYVDDYQGSMTKFLAVEEEEEGAAEEQSTLSDNSMRIPSSLFRVPGAGEEMEEEGELESSVSQELNTKPSVF